MIQLSELKPVLIKGVKILKLISEENNATVFLRCKQKGALFYLKVYIEFYDKYAYIVPSTTLFSDKSIPFINQICFYLKTKIEELNRYRLRVLIGDFEVRTAVPVLYKHNKDQFRSLTSDIFIASFMVLGFFFTTIPLFLLLSALLAVHQIKRWVRKIKAKRD